VEHEDSELEVALRRACMAVLGRAGMGQVDDTRMERFVAGGLTGGVSLPTSLAPAVTRDGWAAVVAPVITVRHEETRRVVCLLGGTDLDSDEGRLRGIVRAGLEYLFPPEAGLRGAERRRQRWTAAGEDEVSDVAVRVGEDVSDRGFAYMDGLGSDAAFLEELRRIPHRNDKKRELAVMCALNGDVEEARETLMRLALPVSQHPTVWDEPSWSNSVAFIEGFGEYFGVDLGIGSWPVKERPGKPKLMQVVVRENGVVVDAVRAAGRDDLADAAARLSPADRARVSADASVYLDRSRDKNVDKAVIRAAIALLDAHMLRVAAAGNGDPSAAQVLTQCLRTSE
jgi:hypothetical protein